jgi:D-alanyl-D-alanine carboxypeptidase
MRFVRALTVALLLGTVLAAAPAAGPSPVRGLGPLPKCELIDVLTIPRGYDDWSTTLVDWVLTLGPDYKPPDLVSVREGGVSGGGLIRKVVIEDLKAMAAAAKKNGTPLVAWSPYRSYKQQEKLFNGYAGWDPDTKTYSNYDSAINFSARPGHSEHQLGLTIDFVGVGDTGLTSNWEVTRTGSWMMKNAWKYGWILSYPKGKQDVVCYSYEPWHYRYVGRDLAKKIHDSGLTQREYLWANFTQLDALGNPIPTATPVPPSPTIVPSAPVTPSPAAPSAGGSSPAPSPGPSGGPAAPVGAILGLDPTVVIAIGLLVAASLALAFALRRARASSTGGGRIRR